MAQATHRFSHPGWHRTHYDREFVTMLVVAAFAAVPMLLIAAYLLAEFVSFDFGALTVGAGFVGITLFSLFMWSGYLFMVGGALFILAALVLSPMFSHHPQHAEEGDQAASVGADDAPQVQNRNVPATPVTPRHAA